MSINERPSMNGDTDDASVQEEPPVSQIRSGIQLYCYAFGFLLLAICCWTLALSFLYCPPQPAIIQPICNDTHYKYLIPLMVPTTTYFVIANWVATGSNGAGQLGLDHAGDVSVFTDCLFEGIVKAMASGGSHTLLLAQFPSCCDLVLYGAGSNAHGQLGQGPDLLKFAPLSIPHPADYSPVLIACAWTTSYIVFRSSSPTNPDLLVSLGSNDFGELGDGDLKLSINENINSIISGQRHVLCLIESTTTSKQRVLGWGAARHGQLSSPCQDYKPQMTTSKGKGKALPRSFASPVEIVLPADERIANIAVGSTHSVYLTESGKMLSAGSDAKGQRSQLPSVAVRVVGVGCCWNGTSCLLQNGYIHTTGSNTHGQLARSDDSQSPLVTAPPVDNFVCGSEHILAITQHDRNLLVCGWNEHGNLGLGDKYDRDCMTVVSGLAPFSNPAWIHAGCGTSFLFLE